MDSTGKLSNTYDTHVLVPNAVFNFPKHFYELIFVYFYIDFYNHIERLASAKSLQEHEFLRMTNGRLEKELEIVQKEREQLLETLKIQRQQIQEERKQSRANSPVTSGRFKH